MKKRANKKITQEMMDGMCDMCLDGYSYRDIAQKIGVSEPTVSKYVGYIRKKKPKTERNRKIALEYKRGKKVSEIAKRYGLSDTQVRTILHRAGVNMSQDNKCSHGRKTEMPVVINRSKMPPLVSVDYLAKTYPLETYNDSEILRLRYVVSESIDAERNNRTIDLSWFK